MAGPSGASKKGKTDKTRTGKGRNTKDDTIYCGYFQARKNTQMKNRGYNVTNVTNASTASAKTLLQMSPIS